MTEIERAIKYIQTAGGAVSGNGGHNHTFGLACSLFKTFTISGNEVFDLLNQYHNPVCDPPWSDKELKHKVDSAYQATGGIKTVIDSPKSYDRPAPTVKPKGKVHRHRFMDATTRPMPDEIDNGAYKMIKACFKEGEGVRIVDADLNEDGKEVPNAGLCMAREYWLEKLESKGGRMNGPGGCWNKNGNPGMYIGINPLEVHEVQDKHVTEFRHALLEFDDLDIEKQWQLYWESELPIAAVIHSGGRSLHAWVRVDAKDRKEYDERVESIYEHFEEHGPDRKNKNPGRLSRLGGCIRMESRQQLLALDIGKNSFSEWLADRALDGIGKPITINELREFQPHDDPNNVIGERWLCRGGSCMVVGPSGVGKSSLTAQAAIQWGLGRDLFGIKPVKALKSLIVQAENDIGDIAEQTQGVIAGMGLDDFEHEQELETINRNVIFVRDSVHAGKEFASTLHRLIDRHQPDLVWIDPLLSFIGDDVSKQSVCSQFLRNWLNPIAEATGVIFMMLHHTGKPPQDSKSRSGWTANDFAYLGTGSSELVNWARAVCVLQEIEEGQFELKLAKRGKRALATTLEGTKTNSVFIKHSDTGIVWEQIDEPERSQGIKTKGKPGPKMKEFDATDWLEDISGKPMPYRELLKNAKDFSRLTGGPGERNLKDIIKTLKVSGDLEINKEGLWVHEKTIF